MKKTRAPKVRAKLHELISDMPSNGLETAELVKKILQLHDNIVSEEYK
jgi:hypothetical protein